MKGVIPKCVRIQNWLFNKYQEDYEESADAADGIVDVVFKHYPLLNRLYRSSFMSYYTMMMLMDERVPLPTKLNDIADVFYAVLNERIGIIY